MNRQETDHFRHLLQVLDIVDPWLRRIEADSHPAPPAAGSPMRGDDAQLDPYQISHASWSSLSHAVDHLSCLRALFSGAKVVPMFAPYTLVRAAFENACSAVWLLQPHRRAERVTRRLQLATTDIHHGEAAKVIIGQSGPRTRAERMDQVRQIAGQCGADEKTATRRADYTKIVGAVGDPDGLMALLWSVCSGIAHGDLWATRAANAMTEQPGSSSPDIGAFKVSANIGILDQFTTITVGMTDKGWKLYDQRSQSARLLEGG